MNDFQLKVKQIKERLLSDTVTREDAKYLLETIDGISEELDLTISDLEYVWDKIPEKDRFWINNRRRNTEIAKMKNK